MDKQLIYYQERDGSTRVDSFVAELKGRFGIDGTIVTVIGQLYHLVRVTGADFEKISGWHRELAWREIRKA